MPREGSALNINFKAQKIKNAHILRIEQMCSRAEVMVFIFVMFFSGRTTLYTLYECIKMEWKTKLQLAGAIICETFYYAGVLCERMGNLSQL